MSGATASCSRLKSSKLRRIAYDSVVHGRVAKAEAPSLFLVLGRRTLSSVSSCMWRVTCSRYRHVPVLRSCTSPRMDTSCELLKLSYGIAMRDGLEVSANVKMTPKCVRVSEVKQLVARLGRDPGACAEPPTL
ncbi:hypothetical protein GQ600_20315 [Phytophthora cactorum]|nr:hypothetical protein GQ600_20315 [Phytophthora cactorum]